jgi:uncharacterized protein YkwD/LysM repeat protein
MRKFHLYGSLIIFAFVLGIRTSPSLAQASSAYDVIAVVNNFRAANGLEPFQNAPFLMSIAQLHSNYQATIGTVSHTSSGGSSPKYRANAAGFGEGSLVFHSKNIACGDNLSIQKAIYKFWQDEAQLYTMLNLAVVYIDAGVGKVGDYVYYTLDAGYYSGAPSSGNLSNPSTNNPNPGLTATTHDSFIVSTPREDGAIIHVVGNGQSLIGIAKAYDVPLNEILVLNNFTIDTIIYPNEEIIIQVGNPPTNTISPTATRPTATASVTATKSTPTPRGTFTPNPTSSPTATPTLTPIPTGRERLVTGVVVMALIIFLAVIVSGLLAGRVKDREID